MAYHADSSDLEVKEILTWEGFGVASRELAQQIVNSGFEPDIIIAVARGGLLPAGALSYAMGVKLSDAINVEFSIPTLRKPCLIRFCWSLCWMWIRSATRSFSWLMTSRTPDAPWLSCWICWPRKARTAAPPCCTVSPAPRSPRITCGSAPTIGSSSPGLLKSPSRHSKTQGRGGLVDVSDYEPAGARISGLQRRRV